MSEAADRAKRWIAAEEEVIDILVLAWESAARSRGNELEPSQRQTVWEMGRSIVRKVRQMVEEPEREQSRRNGARFMAAKDWWSRG